MQPAFHIGTVPVEGRVSLAPMDGISDQPFRLLCKKMGANIIISEFINALDVPDQLNDFSARASFTEYERPFGYQIYGDNASQLLKAATLLEKRKPDFIDLNLGCSVRRVVHRGAGAGLLRNPKKIAEIIRALVNNICVPITIKMRIGWDRHQINFLEIAKIAESEGAKLICVHGRRKDQSWREPADWRPIGAIKRAVKIPVIGNGDIESQNDIARMLSETGCDGVMIGRAALGNPWLLSKKDKSNLSRAEITSTIIQHWLLMTSFFGKDISNVRFKKHLKAYLDCPQFSDVDISRLMRKINPMQFILNDYRELV